MNSILDPCPSPLADKTSIPHVSAAYSFETVNGLGDQAFFQIPKTTGGAVATLLAFKKDGTAVYVSVNNQNLSPDQIKTADNKLAHEFEVRVASPRDPAGLQDVSVPCRRRRCYNIVCALRDDTPIR
jgi:hypothetical protein